MIFGIGNPGKKYINTKHNTGFLILNKFAQKHNLQFEASKFQFEIAGGSFTDTRFFLVKPSTYVNLVGIAARELKENYKFENEDFLVVTDDLNLPFGKIRIRNSGGDGGHNGIHSIIYHFENDNFPRLRFGIGREFNSGEMKNYVLSRYSVDELEEIEDSLDFAVELIEEFISGGIRSMLNCFSKSQFQNRSKEQTNNSN